MIGKNVSIVLIARFRGVALLLDQTFYFCNAAAHEERSWGSVHTYHPVPVNRRSIGKDSSAMAAGGAA
jgi:hypothetical protein